MWHVEGRTALGSHGRMSAGPHAAHRPDIDGLRGLSVIVVMLFHARIPGMEWGYLGVDIFFVISGYLITRILVGELETHNGVKLADFFARRARRILPALFAMLILTAPFAWWLLTPPHLVDYGHSMAAAAVFAANMVQAEQSTGYFATMGDGEALIHLWSLGVEEQFYLLFPLLLWGLYRISPRWLWLMLAIIASASLALRAWLHLSDPPASFYWMPPRMWELLGGAVMATLPPSVCSAFDRFSRPLSILALMLLASLPLARLALGPFAIVHPGFALPTVAATALILVLSPHQSVAATLLRWRSLVAVGLISFSAYLWHQPLLVFARAATAEPLPLVVSLALLLVVLALAAASWRWVEQPFRRAGRWRTGVTLGYSVGASAVIVALGLGLAALATAGSTPAITKLANLRDAEFARMEACSFSNPLRPLSDACRIGTRGRVRVAVHGDSSAAALFGGMGPLAQSAGFAAQEFSRPGCPPMLAVRGLPAHLAHCPPISERFLRHLADNSSITTVVLSARWPYHLEGSTFDNGLPGGKEPDDGTLRLAPEVARDGLQKLVDALQKMGKRVVIAYPVPEAGWLVPDRLLKKSQHSWLQDLPMTVPYDTIQSRLSRSNSMLDGVIGAQPLLRIDPLPLFCDPVQQLCRQHAGDAAWYLDDDHLSPEGAARIWAAYGEWFTATALTDLPAPDPSAEPGMLR